MSQSEVADPRFWVAGVKCAHCGEEQGVNQVGELPPSWIGVIVIEKMASIARTPQEAIREQAQYRRLHYPVCSEFCGAALLVKRGLALARTKNLREEFKEKMEELLK